MKQIGSSYHLKVLILLLSLQIITLLTLNDSIDIQLHDTYYVLGLNVPVTLLSIFITSGSILYLVVKK
jgi:hypothetical protein